MSDHVPSPKFWLEDPAVLVRSLDLFPNESMTRNEKLNSLTRLVIVISAILFWVHYPYWSTFLLASIVGIIVLKYALKPGKTEGFSVPPTYDGINYQETVLAPAFAEEWQIPPVTYDMVDEVFDNVSDTYGPTRVQPRPVNGYYQDSDRYVKLGNMTRTKDSLEMDPYGQYLTTTNQLPQDEIAMRQRGTLSTAREWANDAFTRHRNAYQEDMERIQKKKIARRYSQNLYTVSSAYTSQ